MALMKGTGGGFGGCFNDGTAFLFILRTFVYRFYVLTLTWCFSVDFCKDSYWQDHHPRRRGLGYH
jgi:hypothetical protein